MKYYHFVQKIKKKLWYIFLTTPSKVTFAALALDKDMLFLNGNKMPKINIFNKHLEVKKYPHSYIALNTQFVTSLFVTQNKCHFVIYKSFEKLSLNNFQVIIFERMVKNCFKESILPKICWNIYFSMKKNNIFISNNIN